MIGEGSISFNGNKRANFGGEKSTMQLSGISVLENRRESLKFNVALVVVLESKDLWLVVKT